MTIKNNPLLKPSTVKNGAPQFDEIKTEHFLPALEWAIKDAKEKVEAIKTNTASPTFQNTIEALEFSDDILEQVVLAFENYSGTMKDDNVKAMEDEFYEKITEFSNDISLDENLFKKVKAVYDADQSSLGPEQKKLLENSYKSSVRSGALLSGDKKDRYREISLELSKLSTKFGNNKLDATKAFELYIDDESKLKGIPETVKETAAALAKEKGRDGEWLLTLDMPCYIPVMTYADSRDIREEIWRGFSTLCHTPPHDNKPVIKEILNLKHERAQLLGFKTHADYVLDDRMAKTVQKVEQMRKDFLPVVKPAAEKDLADVKDLAKRTDNVQDIKPWDIGYYADKLCQERFDFDEEELRPYFQFDNVAAGAFEVAEKLYGLKFTESSDYPVYHRDVKVYEMHDKKTGDLKGLLYSDFFPRSGQKQGGAWMNLYRNQGMTNGDVKIPIVHICGNVAPPTDEKPSLMSKDEVITFFHEFGHALHGLNSDVTYRSLSGVNVKWDFVELPSQFNENWAKRKDVLQSFAKHWKTGETIPSELIDKMKDAENFWAGSSFLRQLSLGHLDMSYHSSDPSSITDIAAFEIEACKEFQLLDREGGLASPSFSHIFAGGYSAGYYSYKWAEILEADAFEAFEDAGGFDKDLAEKFQTLLKSGGSKDPEELYRDFRGRDPNADALLRREGLLKKTSNNNTPPKNNKSSGHKP